MQTLQPNTPLQGGKYKIVKVLGQGGFGITYLAKQSVSVAGPLGTINAEIEVTIKEFFIKDFCNRDSVSLSVSVPSTGSYDLVDRFRKKFIKEATNISKLNHPNIIKVLDVFEENGTAYYVMEYISGGSLADLIKKKQLLPEQETLCFTKKIADALRYIHSMNMNHLDIKPANILLRSDGDVVLIDFGLSKNYDIAGEQTTTTPIGVSIGYAPLEQSRIGGVGMFSPATDIYSLGATMFKMLTGQTPPEASIVFDEGLPEMPSNVSDKVKYVVTKSMEPKRKERFQSIAEFLSVFDSIVSDSISEPTPKLIENDIEESNEETCIDMNSDREMSELDVDAIVSVNSNDANKIVTINGVSFEMVFVGSGSFFMGATQEQRLVAWDNEKPVHRITLSNYYIGMTEVTQALWQAVMEDNPSSFIGNNRPVENVSWNDCQEFLHKLKALTGHNFRLPTEAEWEFAARGGNNSQRYVYCGSNTLDDIAWHDSNSMGATHEVAMKQPNELGLYDMSGNVCEWCQDWYGNYINVSQTNPAGPSNGSFRVHRGGSWNNFARSCRLSNRSNCSPNNRFSFLGFRLALSE